MGAFWNYMSRINLFLWIAVVFVAHGILYYSLGTPTWLSTTFLASAFWAVVLFVLKSVGKKVQDSSKNPVA
ncbi:hypothetical protein ACQCN2_18480 [Brevibacillus ginsengisoli]|uniref:hypothetical protein n=1 Tax=Brevibacillus ginsengisoli TaxID=363854 RepID=UPI003CE7D04E